jgi:hypothetical protein
VRARARERDDMRGNCVGSTRPRARSDAARGRRTRRRSIFSDRVIIKICGRLMGGESLRSICNDPKMPAAATVYTWLRDPAKAAFQQQYKQARQVQIETIEDEMRDIADGLFGDEPLARSIRRLAAYKRRLAQLRARKYGPAGC